MMQDIPGTSDSSPDLSFLEAVLQKKDVDLSLQKSEAGSRVSVLRQNGNISRPSSLSKRESINLSRQSLDSSKDSIVYRSESSPVTKLLFGLGHLSLAALILAVLAIQLLVSIAQAHFVPLEDSLINSSQKFEDVLEVGVAMTTLVVVLNLCCLMVCTMQVFFAAKILILSQGEERAKKYLAECSSSRFVAVMGFFVSIPAFFVSLMLFTFLKFRATPAIVSTGLLAMGILMCMLTVMQNIYHWRVEKERADDGFPAYDPPPSSMYKPAPLEMGQMKSELSTLV